MLRPTADSDRLSLSAKPFFTTEPFSTAAGFLGNIPLLMLGSEGSGACGTDSVPTAADTSGTVSPTTELQT